MFSLLRSTLSSGAYTYYASASAMCRQSANVQRSYSYSLLRRSVAGSFSSSGGNSRNNEAKSTAKAQSNNGNDAIRLSRLVASYGTNLQMSRRSAERMIRDGMVTVAGDIITDPSLALTVEDATGIIKVGGRQLILPSSSTGKRQAVNTSTSSIAASTLDGGGEYKDNTNSSAKAAGPVQTRVWLAHKLPGEIVAENDPHGRPSMLDRLRRGGVGKPKKKSKRRVHLKPIGRLDMMTEGLLILTNDGNYAREMELPSNSFHRTYRARVHGLLTEGKMKAIRSGVTINDMQYSGMDVRIEKVPSRRRQATNTWIRVTCSEGKNRQIRKIFDHLGLKVTRLIRTSYGDYDLNTIPAGMAIEVPVKPLDKQKKRGMASTNRMKTQQRAKKNREHEEAEEGRATVQWVRHV